MKTVTGSIGQAVAHRPSMCRVFGLIVTLILTSTPCLAAAQRPDAISSGSWVRLQLNEPGAKWRVGRLMQVSPDSLLLVSGNGLERLTVANTNVARLQLNRGSKSHTWTGALIGFLVGSGAVAAVTIGLANDEFDVDPGAVTGATLAVGVPAACLGALVGSQFKHEQWVDVLRP